MTPIKSSSPSSDLRSYRKPDPVAERWCPSSGATIIRTSKMVEQSRGEFPFSAAVCGQSLWGVVEFV
jgi:hypothetical protein